MRAAMAEAEVGDDLAGEDPTVNRLQSLAAALFAKPGALYVPTGVMANQLAVRAQARPGTEVACGARSHLYCYEDAGSARNAGVQMRPLSSWALLDDALVGSLHHMPDISLVAIENTLMAEGGVPVAPETVRSIAMVARRHGVALHCDGARIFNAAIALNVTPIELVRDCDMVMFCLSKGLGAPIGSVLCGPIDVIERARADRHRIGGGWRQAGIIAAAGIVALETMVERLADDHTRACEFAVAIAKRWPDALDATSVRTNIVCASTKALPDDAVTQLAANDVLAGTIDACTTRFVFHYGITDEALTHAIAALDLLH